MDVLFLGKPDDARTKAAADYLRFAGANVTFLVGEWGSDLPNLADRWRGDMIASYLSRWVVPKSILDRARTALNFHPAPPEWPGIGATNWALYQNSSAFGVTCHEMAARVDAGPIQAVRRFPIFPGDTVESLSERTWDNLLALFYDVMTPLLDGRSLPSCNEQWSGRRRTRADLNDLAKITLGMGEHEALARMRATSYRGFKPALVLGEKCFEISQIRYG